MNTIGQSWYERGKSMLRATFKMKGTDACKVEGNRRCQNIPKQECHGHGGWRSWSCKGMKGKSLWPGLQRVPKLECPLPFCRSSRREVNNKLMVSFNECFFYPYNNADHPCLQTLHIYCRSDYINLYMALTNGLLLLGNPSYIAISQNLQKLNGFI